MPIRLRIFFPGLLLLLALAVGTEVVALHRSTAQAPLQASRPVVVRKSAHASRPPKTVRPMSGRPSVSPARPKFFSPHKNVPTNLRNEE